MPIETMTPRERWLAVLNSTEARPRAHGLLDDA